MNAIPTKTDGTPQLQNGGCVVIYTGYVEDSLDDARGLFNKAEDIERTIAALTTRRDELQAMAYARLNLLGEANERQHRAVLELPQPDKQIVGRALRRHGGRQISDRDLRLLVKAKQQAKAEQTEAAAVAVNTSAAA